MTAPITGLPGTPSTSSTATVDPLAAAVPGGALGKDAFMKLLVTQMQNQDPLDPTDNTQMLAQLAQFSSVEQLQSINQELSTQGSANTALITSVSNSSAVGLLGKTVTASSNQIAVGPNATTNVSTTIPAGGGALTLRILDANGNQVATQSLGTVTAGQQSVPLGKATAGLSAGTYTVEFDLTGSTGAVTNPPPMVTGLIDGVQYTANGAILTSGPLSFPISSIVSVGSSN
jgi:flagellar basal-body rod modification protein FlgD